MGRSYPVAELRGRCRIVRRIWNRSRYEIGHRIEIGLLEMLQTIAPLSEVSDAFRLTLFHLEGWNSALAATCGVLKNLTRTYSTSLPSSILEKKKRKYPLFLRIRSLTYASKTYNWLYDVIYVSNNVVTGVIKPTQFMVEIFIGPLISMHVSFHLTENFLSQTFSFTLVLFHCDVSSCSA